MLARRRWTLTGKMLLDACALAAAFCLAFTLRFEGSLPADFAAVLFGYLPFVVVTKVAVLASAGCYRASWRYTGLREAVRVGARLAAVSALTAAWMLARRIIPHDWPVRATYGLPVGVILLDLALGVLAVVGLRAAARLRSERQERRAVAGNAPCRVPTLLIGAGRAGALAVHEIAARPDTGIVPCGFLDDDPALCGMSVAGVPVLGSTADLAAVSERYKVEQVIITIASAPEAAIRRIVQLSKAAGLRTKIIPPLHEIVGGRLNLATIREVSIEDLLPRKPVHLDLHDIEQVIKDQVVLVTGAGGSIGSELCRTIARLGPATLVLVDQAENSLFHAHWALVDAFPQLQVVPCIADICDAERMDAVFGEYRPAFVFHAAAHKHVPMMEWNPGEAVKNNVLGTRTVATLAADWHVAWFVMISTDKAVNPTSVMGVSKRVAELYIQALGQHSVTRFMTVRFGNVLGSNGSVIPIFQRQIAAGGPVTVTHPEMKRYFMTISEACQLVLQAAALGKGGELFILDMGEPVKIVELARELIRLSGLSPDQDVEIRFTGLRPGEKLFEELSLGEEAVRKTAHPRIFAGNVKALDLASITDRIDELGALTAGADVGLICAKFKEVVPEYEYQQLRPDPGTHTPIKPMHVPRDLGNGHSGNGIALGNDAVGS
jgi:FlaA1/EpsC-like NDP-sugar epimerase